MVSTPRTAGRSGARRGGRITPGRPVGPAVRAACGAAGLLLTVAGCAVAPPRAADTGRPASGVTSGVSATGSAPATAATTAALVAPASSASSGAAAPRSGAPHARTSGARRATPSAGAAASGGDVITAAGAILPDPRRTPGVTNPAVTPATIASTICVPGWTSGIRPDSDYTTSLKIRQLATGYAYHGDRNTGDYEEDHLISLELGGSPTSPRNLWPEPYAATDGARIKDTVENRLHEMVCDHTIGLAAAQRAIATDWFAAYRRYVGTAAPAPTTAPPDAPPTSAAPARTTPATAGCHASMSDARPADYGTTQVLVGTGAAGATVTATAHYKTTDTSHSATADGSGRVEITFRIGRATPGRPVPVDVSVVAHGSTATCSTAFTPR